MKDSGDRYLRIPMKPPTEVERDRLLKAFTENLVRKAESKKLRG